MEYLVVMRVSADGPQPLDASLVECDGLSAAEFTWQGAKYSVAFARSGVPGGKIRIEGAGAPFEHAFSSKVVDTLANWKDDPRYKSWTTEKRFAPFALKGD